MGKERHPIHDSPPWTLEQRVRHLELHLAMLWDHVWWMSLPPERRAEYEREGFPPPIDKFYEELSDGDGGD